MLNSQLIKFGKVIRDKYLFDIYGTIDTYDFLKTKFLKYYEKKQLNSKLINIKRNAFN